MTKTPKKSPTKSAPEQDYAVKLLGTIRTTTADDAAVNLQRLADEVAEISCHLEYFSERGDTKQVKALATRLRFVSDAVWLQSQVVRVVDAGDSPVLERLATDVGVSRAGPSILFGKVA